MATLPTPGSTRPVSKIVSNLMLGYSNDEAAYVTSSLCPPIDTAGSHMGLIFTQELGSQFGDPSDTLERAEGSEYHEALGEVISTSTYLCREYADKSHIDYRTIARNQMPIDLKAMRLATLRNNLLIQQEQRLASVVSSGSVFTNSDTLTSTPVRQWGSASTGEPSTTSDPIKDILTRIEAVEAVSGRRPNTVLLGRMPFLIMLKTGSVCDFLSVNHNRHNLTEAEGLQLLAERLQVEKVLVGKARRRTSAPGQTAVLADIFGDIVWVGYQSAKSAASGNGVAINPTAIARFVEEDFNSVEWDDDNRNSVAFAHKHSECLTVTSALDAGVLLDVLAA